MTTFILYVLIVAGNNIPVALVHDHSSEQACNDAIGKIRESVSGKIVLAICTRK